MIRSVLAWLRRATSFRKADGSVVCRVSRWADIQAYMTGLALHTGKAHTANFEDGQWVIRQVED